MEITCDDFHESNHKLHLLEELHAATGAKFNLFTIPGLCSGEFIKQVKLIPWIDMIPHGWLHPHPRECQFWTYEQCIQYLDWVAGFGLTKGYKAPGWQISDGMYKALLERGYWVADQHYNDERRPPELRVHFHNTETHFHIGHMGGFNANEIELHFDRLLAMKVEFNFIKDLI